MDLLDELAARAGIEPFYHDIWGNRRDVSREGKIALLNALGLPAHDDGAVRDSLHQLELRTWGQTLPPVLVADEWHQVRVPVVIPAESTDTLDWTVALEDGTARQGRTSAHDLHFEGEYTLDDRHKHRRTLVLETLPLGYHHLTVNLPGQPQASMALIVAPHRCITPDEIAPGARMWGLNSQLYGLRNRHDWGMGDFGDLADLAEVAGNMGAAVVGLNPLHALFPADAHHFSPYSPSNRGFLNTLYIDVEGIEELKDCPEAQVQINDPDFQRRLEEVRRADLVDYPAVAALKRPLLKTLYAYFRETGFDASGSPVTDRARDFRAFEIEQGLELHRHATFDALQAHMLEHGPNQWYWRDWPEEYRCYDNPQVQDFAVAHAERVGFFAWLQWVADRQLAHVLERGRKAGLTLGFYQDLAVATSPGGSASWGNPAAFALDASVGAPPDMINPLGQNWGLAPFNPLGLQDAAYRPFVHVLRSAMRHAGVIRIDHVMALQHLFLIPNGMGAEHGGYLTYPFRDLLRIVALESRRNRCIVIGEDLGTVPEGFRPTMAEAGVLSYRVLYFERGHEGRFMPPEHYPEQALVTVSTHDLPTLAGFWAGRDLEWRTHLGIFANDDARNHEYEGRGRDRWLLMEALRDRGILPENASGEMTPELAAAIYRYLAWSPGKILMVQIEDAVLEVEQPNLPGTTDQHPNWRRRMPIPLEDFAHDARVQRLATTLREVRPPVSAGESVS